MDSEILTLQVDINDDPMNQKIDEMQQKITTLKKNAEQTATATPATAMLPGFNSAFDSKLSDWAKDLDSIMRTRQQMDHAMSSYEREGYSQNFKRKVELANASIKDLTNSQNIAQELLNSLGPQMSQVFSEGLKGIVTQLSAGIRTTAKSVAAGVTGKLTDDRIISEYMKGPEYKKIQEQLIKANPNHSGAFSDANMRQYFKATMPMNVPQYMRQAVTGGSQVQFRQDPRSFREMLPTSFEAIPAYKGQREVRQLGSTSRGTETLSVNEIEALNRLVRNNRYAADAAVAAGVMSKSGKKLYYNHGTNHDMVNAMAGFIMDDITAAAGGEKKFGIKDVENPKYWRSISNKRGSNNMLDGGLQAAHAMHDMFGQWLNPGSYSGLKAFNAEYGNAEYVGQIVHSPRKTRRSFAEYTLDMMQNGVQISGTAPVVKTRKNGWMSIPGLTPQSTENEVQTASRGAYSKKITPDDFHTISLNDSLLQDIIMSTPHASRVGHNGFSDNTFYLKYDDKLGDPRLSKDERAKITKQYADVLANGYNANGEHYIATRIGKTHAEFMKASIVDDLGRQALGLAYDTPTDEKIRKAGMAILSNGVYGPNGEGVTHFDTFKPFAKSMYNMNNLATEGESLATWKGAKFGFTPNAESAKAMASATNENAQRLALEKYGTPNMKVVVGRFGEADLDGANLIADTVSDEGFQGRTYGGKATYVPINMSDFRKTNYKQIQKTEETDKRIAELNQETEKKLSKINQGQANEEWRQARVAEIEAERRNREAAIMDEFGGNLVIPGAGLDVIDEKTGRRSDLVIPKDTQVIEDINNIKHYKTSLQGKSQAEMNELRSRDYSRNGIYAKTTYDDAATASRWMSKQLTNSSMNAGFRDPRVEAYFDKVFFDEIARLDNDQYVRDLLFNGDQGVDLRSEEAQQKINNHIAGMWAQYNEGDRLLPTGVFKYAMAAPHPQSAINNRLKEAGIELTPEQEALSLNNDQVISIDSLNKQLGIVRFPATKAGNVTVNNKSAISAEQLLKEGKATEEQLNNLARTSGIVDRKALYFAPNSPILKLLQGEDFDGDLNATFGLSDNVNPKDVEEFSEAMRIISSYSNKEVEEIYKAKPGTPEFAAAWKEQEKRKAAQTSESAPKKGGYSLTTTGDWAEFLTNVPREHAMMGSAERSAEMASLYYAGLNDKKLSADLAQAIKDYESQYDVVSTNMKTDETWKQTQEQAVAAGLGLSFSRMFKYANEAVETFGENDNSKQEWTGKSKAYLEGKGVDSLGLPSIFQGGLMGTLMGRMKARQRGVDPENGVYNWADILNGTDGRHGLALPEGVTEGSAQGEFVRMMRGVRSDFMNSKYLLASNETVDALSEQYQKARDEIEALPLSPKEKQKRLMAIGGKGFENFIQFGATEANANAPWVQGAIQNLASQMGITPEQYVGHASFLGLNNTPSVTVTTSAQLPPHARTVQPTAQASPQPLAGAQNQTLAQYSEELAHSETPEQEARRLLNAAFAKDRKRENKINTLLDANNRDVLLNAVESGEYKQLLGLSGIGEKTAQKTVSALTGSKLLGIRTTPADQISKEIASETVPDVIKENIEQTQEITKDALEAQRKKVGKYMLNENIDPEPYIKIQKAVLEDVKADPDLSSRKRNANPDLKGLSHDEYVKQLEQDINELEKYRDMRNEYRKQQGLPVTSISEGSQAAQSATQSTQQQNAQWAPQPNPFAAQNANLDMSSALAQYNQLLTTAQEFSKNLWGESLTYQKKNEGIPASIIKADKLEGIAAAYERNIRNFIGTEEYGILDDSRKEQLARLISPETGLVAKAGMDFAQISMYKTSTLADDLSQADKKASGTYDAQIEALNKWDEKIKEVEASQQRLLDMAKDPKYAKELQDKFKKSADNIGEDLDRIRSTREHLGASMLEANEKAFDKQIEALEKRRHPGNKLRQQSDQYRDQITNIRETLTKKHDNGLISDATYNSDMSRLKDLEKQTSTFSLSMQQNFNNIGQSISRVINRFGRQLYSKALNEAKKFVQEYSKTMTTIQMITMKSDSQMNELGSTLIDKAKELKISVSEISQSAATLYRQGLSDEEVEDRLEVISKFSKVSGTKVDAATKLITVAMNTGLVDNAQYAADVVTALGDNAATNASEIEKGIEKAGAAAAADGTTFAELAAMLTAITSTTQIGGNVAGRTLNTIFGRMNKIGTNELIKDENGNYVSGSAVAKLLEAQGIEMYDKNGKKRSSYDTLYALSQKWDTMSDAEQQQMANAIAGTRQYSNFAAIMQGMAEGKVSEYMDLTGSAEGTVDKKFDIYTKSLEASLTDLRNTFDGLVADLTSNNALTGVLGTITSMIQGVDNLTNSVGGLGGALAGILPMLIALTMFKAGVANLNMGFVAGGLALAFGTGALLNSVGQRQSATDIHEQALENINSNYAQKTEIIDKVKAYQNKKSLTEEEKNDYARSIDQLGSIVGVDKTSDSFTSLYNSIIGVGDAASQATQKLDQYANSLIKDAEKTVDDDYLKSLANESGAAAAAATESAEKELKEYNQEVHANNQYLEKYYGQRGSDGKYHVDAQSVKKNLTQDMLKAPLANSDAVGTIADTVGGFIANIGWGEYDSTHFYKNDKKTLAKMLMYANFGDDDYVSWDENKWVNYVDSITNGNGVFDEKPFENLETYLNTLSDTEDTRGTAFYGSYKSSLGEMIKTAAPTLSQDEIDVLAGQGVNLIKGYLYQGYDRTAAYNAAYKRLLGFDQGEISRENTNAAIKNNLVAAGYQPAIRDLKIEQNGYETVSAGGYYLNQNGDVVTVDELENRIDTYNNAINPLLAAQSYATAVKAQNKYVDENRLFRYYNASGEERTAIGEKNRKAIYEEQARQPSFQTYTLYHDDMVEEGVYGEDVDQIVKDIDNGLLRYRAINGDVLEGYNEEELAHRQEKDQYITDLFARIKNDKQIDLFTFYELAENIKDVMNLTDEEYESLRATQDKADRERDLVEYAKPLDGVDFEQYFKDNFGYTETPVNYIESPYDRWAYELGEYLTPTDVEEIEAVRTEIPKLDISVYEKLPEDIQQIIDEIYETGMATADDLEMIKKAVAEVKPLEELQAVNDYFLSGAATSSAAWYSDKKNSYAVLSDKMLRKVQSSGATNAKELMDFINITEKDQEWSQLYENSDFGRIMSQVQRDEKGNIISAPANIIDQITDFLYKNGRDFGERELTTAQKGQRALEAFTNLTQNGFFVSQEEREAAQEAGYAKLREEQEQKFNKEFRQKYANIYGTEEYARLATQWSEQNKIQSKQEYINAHPELNVDFLDDNQRKYLEDILGKRLYQKAANRELTDEENAYALMLLQNQSRGLTSMTSRQQLSGIREVRNKIAQGVTLGEGEGQYSLELANAYMAQFSGWQEYASLLDLQNTNLEEFEKAGGQARLDELNASLDQLEKNTQIKIDIEGLQTLEEAGDLLQGTANLIEQLKKGGTFKIEAQMSAGNQLQQMTQAEAMLTSGTRSEKLQALKDLGYTDQTIASSDFDTLVSSAIETYYGANSAYRQQLTNTLQTWYDKGLIDETQLNAAGYETFDLFGGKKAVRYAGLQNGPSRISSLFGQNQTLTGAETAGYLRDIIEGRLESGDNYEAALGSLGYYGTRVASDIANNRTVNEQERRLALREVEQYERDAAEEENLRRLKTSSATPAGAFAYAQEAYRQNNKAGAAADAIFASLTSDKVDNWETLMNSVNTQNASSWKELLEANPGNIAQKLQDLGASITEDGIDFSGVEDAGHSLESVLQLLSEAAAEASNSLKGFKEMLTPKEMVDRAEAYMRGEYTGENEETGYAAFSSLIGNADLAQVMRNNVVTWGQEHKTWQQTYDNMRAYPSEYSEGEIEAWRQMEPELDIWGGVNPLAMEYAQWQVENGLNGHPGLTDEQRYYGLRDLRAAITSGNYNVIADNDNIGMIKDLTQGIDGFDKYAAVINDMETTYKDVTDASERFNKALEKNGINAETFHKAGYNLNKTIKDISGNLKTSSTQAQDNYASYQKISQIIDRISKSQYYKQQWEKGDRSAKTLASIKETAGLQSAKDEEIKKGTFNTQIEQSLNFQEAADIEELENQANQYVSDLDSWVEQFFDGKELTIQGPGIEVTEGGYNVDLGSMVNGVTGEINAQLQALAAALQQAGIDAHIETDTNGDHVKARVVIDSLRNAGGSGRGGGGGGGGGGGKSEADKLLEEQKHRVSEIQHLIKMQQIAESHYDRTNNQGAYFGSLENEIALQHRLGDEYQRNIAEMQAQLAQVAEGSDDWKKLTEAIWQAEEAYAAIQDEIAAIQKKKLVYIEKQQSYADSKTDFSQGILQSYAQRYLDTDRFKDYEGAISKEIEVTRQIIQENDSQIAELESSLHLFEEGSDEFRQVEADIMAVRRDTAEKENEAIELQLELDRQRLAQISKVLQYNTAPAQHSINMADTYSGYYEKAGYLREAQAMTAKNQEQYQKLIEENTKAMDAAIDRMNAVETGSVIWYEARDAADQYEEAVGQLNVSLLETEEMLQELEMRVIETDFTDATRPLEHSLKLLSDVKAEAQDTGDYEAYTEAIEKTLAVQAEYLDAQREAIRRQREFIAENDLTPEMRRQAEEQLNQYEENYSNTIREINNEKRELQKAQVDELTEKFDRRKSNYEHNLKLIQYQETIYSNNNEWTNVNNMLEQEIELKKQERTELEQENLVWHQQLDELQDNEKEYAAVTEKIKKNEEQIQSITVEIEKNTKAIEENRKKILQATSKVKDGLRQRIEDIKKYDRETLASTVSMENTVLEAIKNRYREEWNAKKRGLEEDKKILSEQKQLINERLNARKKAADEAEKYEELAELRSQLAIIRADPSRTKDAKELERKIRDLEKDTAMSTAEQEAEANQKSLDDQITAIDDFVRVNEENLSELLSDANNFAGEVGQILTSSYEEVVLWLQENSREYRNSLADAQQQMINSWEDTWKRMHEITDDYWDRIYTLMFSEESYVNYMMETERKLNGEKLSPEAYELKETAYREQYQDMMNATNNDAATFEIHEHDIPEVSAKVSEIIDIEGEILGTLKAAPVFKAWHMFEQPYSDKSTGETIDYLPKDYSGWGYVAPIYIDSYEEHYEAHEDSGGPASPGGPTKKATAKSNYEPVWDSGTSSYSPKQTATGTMTAWDAKTTSQTWNIVNKTSSVLESTKQITDNINKLQNKKYAGGGYVDYTGPAWVDGTPSHPEAFLNSYDTESIRMMLDEFNYIRKLPTMPHLDAAPANSNTVSIGDIHVNLYEAKLNSDADYDEVAKKVGKAFSKELKNNGINLANYAW